MRVVLDTNVIVSAVLNPGRMPDTIVRWWREGRFDLVTSPPLIEELRRALNRPRLVVRHGWSIEQQREYVDELERDAIVIVSLPAVVASRDPDDDQVLATAIAGEADYVVSGDKDLLDLGEFEGLPIIAPGRFIAILSSERLPP